MIVTLAGHVDHGKTSLVQALTGVNTDRLEEEKRRGLTIDLGFAYLRDAANTLGFVDVPGHHRFIHNMVAGISAQQHALLVIAADDGPMPQSREHLQILNLLGIEQGFIALTKCDRVTSERRQEAREEIDQLLQDSCLEGADVFDTSVETGEGIEDLKDRLLQAASQHSAPAAKGELRLPIDRAFTIAGAGVVVTGTIHSGSVSPDQVLTLFPSMTSVRVKSVRAQDRDTVLANVGDRCALNLSGVDIGEVARGQWLTSDPSSTSREFSIRLSVLADFPRPLRHWLPVHIYHATSHTTGRVALLSESRLAPGTEELVELVTDDALLLRRGDRLVLRDQGLDRTLGGGMVVSTRPADGRRRGNQRLKRLSADDLAEPNQSLSSHLELGAVSILDFKQNWGLSETELDSLLAEQSCERVDDHAVQQNTWLEWQTALLEEINRRHQADASLQGLKQSELATRPGRQFLTSLLNHLVASGKLMTRAGRFLPVAHQVALSDSEAQLLNQVQPLLDQSQPPSLGDMAKNFRLGVGDLAKRLHPLVSKKSLVRISETRYYLPAQLHTLSELAGRLDREGPFTVRQFRDAANIGRNVAIEVLEHFDRIGFTRRDNDTRRVIGSMEYPAT